MLGTSGRSARRAGHRSRLGTLGVALLPLLASLLALPASADPCPDGGLCLSAQAIRQCDADQSALPELRLQFRVSEQRLTVASGDALVLARALEAQSALVVTLRRELRAARPWLAGGWWYLLGVGSAVAAGVVLALSL